jgi:2-methylcitrate dehydratase PrpD
MGLERELAEFASETTFANLPEEPVTVIKKVVLTILGTTIAGAASDGCRAVVDQAREWGGREEATLFIHGGKVPAFNAAFANSFMARALDFDDGMFPGVHLGASTVPTALAMAERAGGCTGKEFLTALVVGSEIAARLNLSPAAYDGFDPTGVCSVFASCAVAGKLLDLHGKQMMTALALAFNRSGGSFQSNIDGSLAVRLTQGFVSQSGIICAQMAQRGVTGPESFLEGVYGYFHLFAKDDYDSRTVISGLGRSFKMSNLLFKKYPSCGGTLASTDAILELVSAHGFGPEDVERILIRVTPAIYNLTGQPFKIGENPTVDAQFSIRYCVANALLRKAPELKHFDESFIRDPEIAKLIKQIEVIPDVSLNEREHRTADMRVMLKDGRTCHTTVDQPRGFPLNPLTEEEHREKFLSCLRYGGGHVPREAVAKAISLVDRLEDVEDVRTLITLLLI